MASSKDLTMEIPDNESYSGFLLSLSTGLRRSNAVEITRKSFDMKRSTNSVSIVSTGLSGSGISHTLNSLLGQDVAGVGVKTESIGKYSVPWPSLTAGISNSRIQFYDVPGLPFEIQVEDDEFKIPNDVDEVESFSDNVEAVEALKALPLGESRGLQAQSDCAIKCLNILMSLNNMFKERKYFPNCVILTCRFEDLGHEDDSSHFVKTLQLLKDDQVSGSLVDFCNPNLIILLTRFCDNTEISLEDLKMKIQQTVSRYLGIKNIQIVVAENQAVEHQLRTVPSCNCYILPNGELFPRNIFEAIKEVTKDPLSQVVIGEVIQRVETLGKLSVTTSLFDISNCIRQGYQSQGREGTETALDVDEPSSSHSLMSSLEYLCGKACDIPMAFKNKFESAFTLYDVPGRSEFNEFASTTHFPVIDAFRTSFSIKRSTNSVDILQLGFTGAGKSHTINNLLDHSICELDAESSCTQVIQRLSIRMPCKDLFMKEAALNIIDTPGFGDTNGGIEFDAKVLANIGHYFESRGYFPNYILLVINITDKRLGGQFSNFAKLLQAIKLFLGGKALDFENPNLIIVATHLGSLTPIEIEPSKVQERIKSIQQKAMQHLGSIKIPVVVAENRFKDYQLEQVGDFFKLQNGDIYPQNIYCAMRDLSKDTDPVGFRIINEAYPKLCKEKPPITKEAVQLETLRGVESIIEKLRLLSHSCSTEIQFSLREKVLQWGDEKLNLPGQSVEQLSENLAGMGYSSKNELPLPSASNMQLLEFFRQLAPDRRARMMLEETFNLKPPTYDTKIIGKSYNLSQDLTTDVQIAEVGPAGLSGLGFIMSGNLLQSSEYSPSDRFFFNVAFESKVLVSERLCHLGLQRLEGFTTLQCPQIAGFNLFERTWYGRWKAPQTVSALYEYRRIKLSLDPLTMPRSVLESIECLPSTYQRDVETNRNLWLSFFETHGSHFVLSAHLGGTVIFQIENVVHGAGKFMDIKQNEHQLLDFFFRNAARKDSGLSVRVQGGDPEERARLERSSSAEEYYERLESWKASLLENPVITDLSIRVDSIGKLVSNVDEVKGLAFNEAVEDLVKVKEADFQSVSFTREEAWRHSRNLDVSFQILLIVIASISILNPFLTIPLLLQTIFIAFRNYNFAPANLFSFWSHSPSRTQFRSGTDETLRPALVPLPSSSPTDETINE